VFAQRSKKVLPAGHGLIIDCGLLKEIGHPFSLAP